MRLIDLDALGIGKCNPDVFNDKGCAKGWNSAIEILQNAPTVDAVPVVHGKWIPFEGETGVEAFGYKEYTTLGFGCSVCHADIDVSEQYFRYCPMCGAKMDGERKGGDE